MAILKYLTSFVLMILLTGCYENFNPEIETNPVLCLNSLITSGEPIIVKISHTWVFNDGKDRTHEVSDAKITIFVNEKIVDNDYIPKEGDKIRIFAESPTYGAAIAEVIVPFATPIGKVTVTPLITDIWKRNDIPNYEMLADITFNLNIEMDVNDTANTDNYYYFGYNRFDGIIDDDNGNYDGELAASGPGPFSIGRFEYNAEPIFKEHIGVFETIMDNDEHDDFLFFTDRQFPGKTYTLHLNYTNNIFSVNSREYNESLLECGMILYLTTVSESYYNWAVYKWNADEGIIGDLSDIGLAEPKWGYSNVSTGAGVVAAQSSAKYIVNLKEFLKSIINQPKNINTKPNL